MKLKIRMAKSGESYHAGWGGHYKGPDGKTFLLTKPVALTFSAMSKLRSSHEQFELFCLAYLREMSLRLVALGGDEVMEIERRLIARYGSPWKGNVKNTLPTIGDYSFDPNVIKHGCGLNLELLKQKFNSYASYEFVVYDHKVKGPLLDDMGRAVNNGDQLWDLEIGNYTYYQAGPYKRAFAIPNSVEFPELRKRLAAAALSINLGIDSIDHTFKHYTDSIDYDLGTTEEPAASLLGILEELRSRLKAFEKEHDHQHDDHSVLGIVAASYALTRCQSTFEACLVLSGRGFFIDACILGRHVIEQVAWALRVSHLNEMDAIWKVEPQKCISELRFHPYGGRLYSDLTDFAHLSAKSRHEYLRIVDDRPVTIYRSTEDALRLSPLLILALDIYISGCELFFMKECCHINLWQSWKSAGRDQMLNPERPLMGLFAKHHSKYRSPIQDS